MMSFIFSVRLGTVCLTIRSSVIQMITGNTIIISIQKLSPHKFCVVHTSKLIINHTQKPRPVEGIFWRGHLVLLMCKFEDKLTVILLK